MNAEHTPTPWRITERAHGYLGNDARRTFVHICEDNGDKNASQQAVCDMDDFNKIRAQTDAAFIVRAVNAHDALVTMLKDAARLLEFYRPVDKYPDGEVAGRSEILTRIDAALKLAEG